MVTSLLGGKYGDFTLTVCTVDRKHDNVTPGQKVWKLSLLDRKYGYVTHTQTTDDAETPLPYVLKNI